MVQMSISDVVSGGFCVGCGACAAAAPDVRMHISELGIQQADLDAADATQRARADSVCPFSAATPDETVVGNSLFQGPGLAHDERIGHFDLLAAGFISDDAGREASSSGGLTNWMLGALLEAGRIDGVIHVGAAPADGDGALFGYRVSTTRDEIRGQRKSKYYSTEMSEAIAAIRGDGRRYAFVGVPCFVTAARHLSRTDPEIGAQLVYFVGLVCGHMKSMRFAEAMAWQIGVAPEDLADVDFRLKVSDATANRYHFAAKSKTENKWRSHIASSLYGGNWGTAFFQLKACDYCDDIFAETADIAFGDAWIPRYENDWLGTNILVSRRPELTQMLKEAEARGEVHLEALSRSELANSQAGNFRHRRDGLSLRLADAARRGEPTLKKRVAPGSIPQSAFRKIIIRLRQRTAARSHLAFAKAREAHDLGIFMAEMRPLTRTADRIYRLQRLLKLETYVAAAKRRLRRFTARGGARGGAA